MKFLLKRKYFVTALVILIAFGSWYFFTNKTSSKITYETSKVERGTLIKSISGSGTITAGNNTTLTTKVSGVVDQVFVTNGDKVVKGQKLASVKLDDYASERQTKAWVEYLDATLSVKESVNNKAVSDIDMWKAREEVLDAQEAYDDMLENDTNPATHAVYTEGERMIITKTLDQKRKAFSVMESKYLNSNADIAYSNAKVAAAFRDYQENSANITAPTSGIISDLALAKGLTLQANSSTSNTTGSTIVSSQTIGKISNPNGQLTATISLSEVDVLKVEPNQKVTLTLDAYEDISFTGKVLSVDTSGSISSGVTNYPVIILLDPVTVPVYTNMAVSATIITDVKTEVIMIPSTAITQSNSGTSSVQIKKNNQVSSVEVQTGLFNDSQTEITSGVSEGDEIVTAVIDSSSQSTSSSTSPFSGTNRSSGSTTRVFMGGPGF